MGAVESRGLHFGVGTRRVAAAHFLGAGLLLAAAAVWMAVGYQPGPVMDAVTDAWIARAGETTVLNRGGALTALGPTAATAVAIALGVAAAVQFGAAVCARRGRRWPVCLGAGLAGVVTVVAFPLAFVGFTLASLSRSRPP